MLGALLVVYYLILYQVGILLLTAGLIGLTISKQDKALCQSSDYEFDLYVRSIFGKYFRIANIIGLVMILLYFLVSN